MRLALGTVQFGMHYGIANQSGQVGRADARSILALAQASGMDTLDTAIAYGESEICLGKVGTEGFKIITKLPAIADDTADIAGWINAQLQASLHRLGVPSVYGLLLHRSQQLVGPSGKAVVQALAALKADGLVQKIGVSIYAPYELDSVTQACQIELVQAPLNLLDQRLLTSGWLHKLHAAGVEVHTRSAFLQGLLLMPRAAIPEKFSRWSGLWDTWYDWLSNQKTSATQACLGFVQSQSQINKIVVGVDSATQLQQLIAAARTSVTLDWPAIGTDDERLINPSYWATL